MWDIGTVPLSHEPTSPTEAVKSDVNIRIKKALNACGIEIPYNHVSVVMGQAKEAE